jgi:Cytochrome c oxidase subunit IV
MAEGHGSADPKGRPERTAPRLFLGVAAFMTVVAVVYWFTSYEQAGTAMLGLSAALAALIGAYLEFQDRYGTYDTRRHAAADTRRAEAIDVEDRELYLPHASVWPFGIGVGAVLASNGLILGFAYAVPGAVVIAVSIVGFIRQSRARA